VPGFFIVHGRLLNQADGSTHRLLHCAEGALKVSEKRPRRVREGERCTDLVQTPVPPALRADLVDVARRMGYTSVAAINRDVLMAFIRDQKAALATPKPAA